MEGWYRDGDSPCRLIPGKNSINGRKKKCTSPAKERTLSWLPSVPQDPHSLHWVANRYNKAAQRLKNLPAEQATQVRSLGWEDTLKKGMATHSSILAWWIPWTEETGGLQSMGSQSVGHDWITNTFIIIRQTCIEQSMWPLPLRKASLVVINLKCTEMGLLWQPSGTDFAFQCRGYGFSPWLGSHIPHI